MSMDMDVHGQMSMDIHGHTAARDVSESASAGTSEARSYSRDGTVEWRRSQELLRD
jgi:hypothetical protein